MREDQSVLENIAMNRDHDNDRKENEIILAYRYYSAGIVAANYFMLCEESKQEDKSESKKHLYDNVFVKETSRQKLSHAKSLKRNHTKFSRSASGDKDRLSGSLITKPKQMKSMMIISALENLYKCLESLP